MFVFVYNAHHYDMNYLLTYYFIDFLLYQLWKCRDIYMFLFFLTPCVSLASKTRETIIFDQMKKLLYICMIWINLDQYIQCKDIKALGAKVWNLLHLHIISTFSPITMQVTNLNQMCFFHRSDSIFISDAML